MNKTIRIRIFVILTIAVYFLTGCATKVDKNIYHKVELREGEILPAKNQQKQERPKIVVLETEVRSTLAIEPQLGELFAIAIEKELNDSGAEVIDRKLSIILRNELKLAEFNGVAKYTGPQVVQYAIRGQINSMDYVVTQSAQLISRIFKNKNDIPVRFDHKSNVKAAVKIYEFPSLRLLTAINVSGSASENDAESGENKTTGATLLKMAINHAIRDKSHELKNYFSPKGYVAERQANATQSMFKVFVGREQGVKAGDNIVIYSPRRNNTDALSGSEPMEELEVAQGYISDRVGDSVSWVVVEDKASSERIRLGDYVRVKYEENSLYEKLMR